ncbi:BnaC09g41530D [Brassica napus]|uniref:BnaC09g41530D protein n=1 Tax=Brassica napus TaxID=3708 RepID=A0A078IYR8_BRANA|nr:BnaC09g41530D [Brassica napus]
MSLEQPELLLIELYTKKEAMSIAASDLGEGRVHEIPFEASDTLAFRESCYIKDM